MIPKILHYCWFGGRPKTKLAQKCLESWRRHLQGWDLREWSEENFPMDDFPFASAAARERRWAVVSDIARYWCLEKFGGVYLDMDVELLAPIDDLILPGPFVASEVAPHEKGVESVNPGGGLALPKRSIFAREMLNGFSRRSYNSQVEMMGIIRELVDLSLLRAKECGEIVRVLPSAVFSPIQPDGRLLRCPETHGIHWYAMSGYPFTVRLARWLAWHHLGWFLRLLRRCR